ncbi:MAG TPA: alpha/beta fold hydrolase [Chloroflexota bacterium]|nr:alpha/beta fold hydrolase [Chloroflexota bacterium]
MLEIISRQPETAQYQTPLLFVHGAWHGAWCWEEFFLPYFAEKGWATYALSLRGHGNSPGREKMRGHSVNGYVSDVVEVAQTLPAAPVVIGHSMGGLVVQKYLERYHAPAGVLLAAVPPHGVIGTTLRLGRNHPGVLLKTNLTLSMQPVIGTQALAREMFFSEEMPEDEVVRYYGRMHNESFRAFNDMLWLNLPKPKRVKAPMLVLGGTKDTIFTGAEVKSTAVAYNTEAVFFDMAHDMMLEAGWIEVADHIINWLRLQGIS